VDVRERGAEDLADFRSHRVATRREPPSLQNEARDHEDERDRRENSGAGKAAPHRLTLAVITPSSPADGNRFWSASAGRRSASPSGAAKAPWSRRSVIGTSLTATLATVCGVTRGRC